MAGGDLGSKNAANYPPKKPKVLECIAIEPDCFFTAEAKFCFFEALVLIARAPPIFTLP